MPANRTQGDLKLVLTEEGADLEINGGQPTMDAGLGTAVILSLLSSDDWAGNALLPSPQQVGGSLERVLEKPLQLSTLIEAENAAKKDLAWMTKTGVASEVKVTVTNPVENFIRVTVLVTPPGSSTQEIQITRHGQNWILQASDFENTER